MFTIKLIFLLSIITVSPAFAYSDPGSGLLLLQLLGSALVGVLFYFNKIKEWVLGKLGKKSNDEQK